jgi:hypothetical protein
MRLLVTKVEIAVTASPDTVRGVADCRTTGAVEELHSDIAESVEKQKTIDRVVLFPAFTVPFRVTPLELTTAADVTTVGALGVVKFRIEPSTGVPLKLLVPDALK